MSLILFLWCTGHVIGMSCHLLVYLLFSQQVPNNFRAGKLKFVYTFREFFLSNFRGNNKLKPLQKEAFIYYIICKTTCFEKTTVRRFFKLLLKMSYKKAGVGKRYFVLTQTLW